MQKNVGTVDATIRITMGLLGLAYGIGKMSRRPHRTPWLLMTLSAMKVAEGVTRFCPMLYSMGMNTSTREGLATAKAQLSKMGDNFVSSQMAQFAEAIGDNTSGDKAPVDFDLDEASGKTAAKDATPAKEPTRHVRTRESVRKTVRSQAAYKQDEQAYPTYS